MIYTANEKQLGIALRISLSQGLHRDMSGDSHSESEAVRRRNLWWTLYVLDRKFSSLMGAPSSIQDGDIAVSLIMPRQVPQKANSLEVHVKLSCLIAKVLNSKCFDRDNVLPLLTTFFKAIYGIEGKLDSSFFRNMQTVLREMAGLAPEVNASFNFKADGSEPLSRLAATINLCYHQVCISLDEPFPL